VLKKKGKESYHHAKKRPRRDRRSVLVVRSPSTVVKEPDRDEDEGDEKKKNH
jgi:hypothetical protein